MGRDKEEKELDRAVEKTFPASDPIAPGHPTSTEPPGSDPHRQAPVLSHEEVEAAAPKTEVCPTCHGSGKVDANDPLSEKCPQCLGLGRVVIADQAAGQERSADPVDTGHTSTAPSNER